MSLVVERPLLAESRRPQALMLNAFNVSEDSGVEATTSIVYSLHLSILNREVLCLYLFEGLKKPSILAMMLL